MQQYMQHCYCYHSSATVTQVPLQKKCIRQFNVCARQQTNIMVSILIELIAIHLLCNCNESKIERAHLVNNKLLFKYPYSYLNSYMNYEYDIYVMIIIIIDLECWWIVFLWRHILPHALYSVIYSVNEQEKKDTTI